MKGFLALLIFLSMMTFAVSLIALFFKRVRKKAAFAALASVILFFVAVALFGQTEFNGEVRASSFVDPSTVKARAVNVDYQSLARQPAAYTGNIVFFEGKVIQVMESGPDIQLRANVTKGQYDLWSDTIFVSYHKKSTSESRILDNDIIKLWGEYRGIMSYKSIFGQTIQIPHVAAAVIEQ